MTEKKVWLITGAGRGLGVHIAKAVLATGHAVVATGRDGAKFAAAIGDHDNLLAIKLDVTRPQNAQAAVGQFGRIDVLVNNAGNFFAGFFEELSPEQVRNQIETLLFGPMNVTRAVLPVMRKQRSGLVLTISSTAGIAGQMFCTAYAAAKFGIEGWMESLTPEIALFGIRTMLVEPVFFVPSCSPMIRPRTPSPRSMTMPRRRRKSSRLGRAWMGSKAATLPNSPTPSLSSPRSRNRPPASLRASTPCRHLRPRPTRCLPRPKPTAVFRPLSRTTTLEQECCYMQLQKI